MCQPDHFLVQFDLQDPARPQNWPLYKKLYLTFLSSLTVLNATFASSIPTGIMEDLIVHLKVSNEVATLTISLFVCGYCVGPQLWGPLSEQYGRRRVYLYPFLLYTVAQVGCALSQSISSLLVLRFLAGVFAAAPITITGAYFADMWSFKALGNALAFGTIAPFIGPTTAPIVSGYIQVAGVDWHWVFRILSIFAGTILVAIIFTLEETYEPFLAVRKAQQKRKDTGNSNYYALLEQGDTKLAKRMKIILLKPFRIFIHEPMLIAVTGYLSFIYGCLYLNFEAYSVVFIEGYHLNAGESALMFIPILIGATVGIFMYIWIYNPRYLVLVSQHAPSPVPPEARLDVALWAGPFLSLSIFWFGWTSYPSISYWAPMMSGIIFGCSYILIFQGMFNYTIDAYVEVAASAVAASTIIRSLIGAIFPLFATQMYRSLNPRLGSTVLGCLSLLGAPIPFVLIKYGPKLRIKSKYAPASDITPITRKEQSA